MRIKTKNFGPITKANIRIRPLTILIGRNNIGKSYLTQLIQVLLDSLFGVYQLRKRRLRYPYRIHRYLRRRPWLHITEREVSKLRKMLKNEKISSNRILLSILTTVKRNLASEIAIELKGNFEQIFGMRLGRLVSLGASQSIIEFQYNEHCTLKVAISSKDRLHTEVLTNRRQGKKIERILLPNINETRQAKRKTRERLLHLYQECIRLLYTLQFEESIYIPAGRAGLLESYDIVAAALFNLSSVAAVYGISMPPLSGVAARFYNRLLALRNVEGSFSAIADKMKSILLGSIHLRRERTGPYRIYYTFKVGKKSRRIEVIHAASMIKELAPIHLIIREDVEPNSLLIIEEPESHLHPNAQCLLMEIFSELISGRANIMITTHSDLIIRKIGNLIGHFRFPDLRQGASLSSADISIYLLKEGRVGSISKEIPIPQDGIFEEIPEFDDVIKNLYEEQLEIQQKAQLGE